ncbi:hypothetical protein [Pelistega sp. MC2]|uniref:hypothetical protein n=1 Tax=Pelistega sp. MC2 TaxID=1720297 RepID=UPI0008D9A187|nr:hypothetical protein [Pelistega sp. MC2]
MDALNQLLRGFLFFIFTLVGLFITFSFLVIGVITFAIMYLIYTIRGKKFSASDYWQQQRTRAKATQTQFNERFRQPNYSRRKAQEISDVELRNVQKED